MEIDSGLLGSDSIVGTIPRSLLGDAAVVRLAHHALSGSGSEDALITRDGAADGAAILVLLPQPAPAPLLSGLGIALVVLLLFGIGFTQWRYGRWGAATVLVMALAAGGAVIAYAAFGDPAAVDDPADAVPPDSRAEIVASFAMTTDSELGLRLDIENIAFNPCAGKADGTTCDAGMDGVVLTCESQACGACVPTGTCSTTTTTSCAFNEDCPGVETCNVVTPSPRYVDNGDQTVTDRQTCLVWEMKTGTVGASSYCPGGANCGDPHHVNNRYQWSSSGTLFDGGAKTLFLDALNDVGGGGTSCFAGHCDWRLASSGGDPAGTTGERAELESILLMPFPCGSSPCIDPIFGPAASDLYWSATTYAPSTNDAWSVNFLVGNVYPGNKPISTLYVRAVRSGS